MASGRYNPDMDIDDDYEPVRLYSGKVMHARLKPVLHRFSYGMSSLLIDIDRLEEADEKSVIFSVNKPNLVSFQQKDFGPKDGSPLRPYIDRLMAEAQLPPAQSVHLMCYPRVFGYGFNPISVYFCFETEKRLTCMIYEVRNTFGESHTYVEPVRPDQLTKASLRQETRKQFYVSPFMDMEMRYHFRVKPPVNEISFRILETDAKGPILAASFFGKRLPFSTASLLKTIGQTCGLTWKVTAGIHYEAAILWFKGLKIRPRLKHRLSHSLPEGHSKH